MATNTETFDALDELQSQPQVDGMAEQMARTQRVSELQNELLGYSPEELLAELNAESKSTGVYGFEYLTDVSAAADIPGMNAVSYSIPGDENGGVYVGYESYEQTFARAQEEYQSIAVGGGVPTQEQEDAYADATRCYTESKSEYEDYLANTPGAPDYLREGGNPVEAYAAFEIPRAEEEAKALAAKETADTSISMDEVNQAMNQGAAGTIMVNTEANENLSSDKQSVQAASVSSEQYAARISEEIDAVTIMGMANYQSSVGADIPEVSAPCDTDEYGKQVVERLKVIDAELAGQDSSYESAFPANMQYYADGQNPQAIPGMTLVVGKVEGAPGFYAGYETYDATYKNSLAELDVENEELERLQNDPTMDSSELVERQEANQKGYESANATYDMQKNQYGEYLEKNPGNDFIGKENPVDEFNHFQQSLPVQQQTSNAMVGVKEWFVNAWEKLKTGVAAIGAWISGKTKDPNELTADEAEMTNEQYWQKRAELNPEDETAKAKLQEFSQGQEQDTQRSGSDNPFRAIVNENMNQMDTSYEPQHQMSSSYADYSGVKNNTGNQLLDELNYGNTGTVDSMVASMPDSSESMLVSDSVPDTSQALDNGLEPSVQNTSGKKRSADLLDRLNALDERLQAGAASAQAENGYGFGR